MKRISVCIPCFNEQDNIKDVYNRLNKVIDGLVERYEFEIIFSDNASKDDSIPILRELASKDKRVKVILNERNFGPYRSNKNCYFNASGDAIISMPCDLQEPPELIPTFLEYWEQGYKCVWGQKISSNEGKIKYQFRKLYYKILNQLSDVPQMEQVTGFGITDKVVIEMIKKMNDPFMPIRNLVAELGYEVKLIPYAQESRKKGKSSYNIWRYFDFAMSALTRTSKLPLRLATFLGLIISFISFLVAIFYFVLKLIFWDSLVAGMAPLLIAVFFLGGVQLMFIGIIGEYIGVILEKVTVRPLVVEKEKINFDD